MKTCSVCQETKPLTEFHSTGYNTLANGTQVRRHKPDCKSCANVKWKQRVSERIRSIVPEMKCAHCGYDKCVEALEFHHTNPEEKEFTVASRWCVSEEKLRAEIGKCVLLCCLCHRELHAGFWRLNQLGE